MPTYRRERDRPHLRWTSGLQASPFSPVGKGREPGYEPKRPPQPLRGRAHGQDLANALRQIHQQWATEQRALAVQGDDRALYIVVEAVAGFEPPIDQLGKETGAEVVAIPPGQPPPYVTWRVPEAAIAKFIAKFEAYANLSKVTPSGLPRHRDLVEFIARLRRATIEAFWTADRSRFPAANDVVWWEVWLRSSRGQPELARLRTYLAQVDAKMGREALVFGDRSVALAFASANQLAQSIDLLADLAELRPAAAVVLGELPPRDQWTYMTGLQDRIVAPRLDAPAVCILDTGVAREHPLLAPALAATDHRAARPEWGSGDHHGHGTEMAGVALFGDLRQLTPTSGPVQPRHRLESCKLLPPPPDTTEPRLWGRITNDAVTVMEQRAEPRRRAFAMPVTVEETRCDEHGFAVVVPSSNRGLPSSWSGAVDAIAAGIPIEPDGPALRVDRERARQDRRLFLVSAGNNGSTDADYLRQVETWPVADPAHAWNALTVGAYTELDEVELTERATGAEAPLALRGDLSPYTTSSMLFSSGWPIKPEVLFEGGNKLRPSPAAGQALGTASLSLTTTYYRPHERPFCETWATSPASMLAAKMAAEILVEHPDMWPETVRALMVHSARWTPAMERRKPKGNKKAQWLAFHRMHGYGVPDLSRALKSAANAVTLMREAHIVPLRVHNKREVKFDQWHEYALPWPTAVLQGLGSVALRLRVTLSYFVDPHPVRSEREPTLRYASCGLRFELKRPTETAAEFHARTNRRLRHEVPGKKPTPPAPKGWLLGEERHHGSLHHDVWTGTAAELATMDRLIVYPVHGWWRHGSSYARLADGLRYALVVTIETVDETLQLDLYTPVSALALVPVAVSQTI